MTIAAILFLFCALGLFLYRGLIGEKTFFGLSVVLMITLSVTVMGPNTLEVNIGGNTLKALRQETERAQEALSALRELRADMLSVELKRITNSPSLKSSFYQTGTTKAEEIDQFMSVLVLLRGEGRLDAELLKNAMNACNAVLARQHALTEKYWEFSESEVIPGMISRARVLGSEGFRARTSGEIESDLDELHRKIANTPGQSLENDKNRELRLEAVENYKHLSDVCSALANAESP